MRDSLLQYRRVKDVTVNSEFSYYKDDFSEFVLDIDRERLVGRNIPPEALFDAFLPMFTRASYVGAHAGADGTEPVFMCAAEAGAFDVWNLMNYAGTASNSSYKLAEVATIENTQAAHSIAKENQQYRLCLQFDYIGTWTQAQKAIRQHIDRFNNTTPIGYKAESDGGYYIWDDNSQKQYWLLLIIIAIVYFISGILFNSWTQPFVIVFIIPVSFIGIFLTFRYFELLFDQGGFASFVLLAGLSVNANIYILNEYNNIRAARPGLSPRRACIKAWNAKIRPIFLTVVSTVLGFIPFMAGQLREAFWFPLAAGASGGLIFSMLALFLLLPMLLLKAAPRS
jgi:multidrug efflux pump subunit AcrB